MVSEKTLSYALVGLAGLAVALLAFTAFTVFTASQPPAAAFENTQANYLKAIQAQNPVNVCETPAGYTDAQWREHMSHHPNQYAECLKNASLNA